MFSTVGIAGVTLFATWQSTTYAVRKMYPLSQFDRDPNYSYEDQGSDFFMPYFNVRVHCRKYFELSTFKKVTFFALLTLCGAMTGAITGGGVYYFGATLLKASTSSAKLAALISATLGALIGVIREPGQIDRVMMGEI